MIFYVKKFLQDILLLLGYQIRKKNKFFIDPNHYQVLLPKVDKEWKLIIESKKKTLNNEQDLLTNIRFYSLIQNINFILKQRKVFDFVELGCWNGHSSYIISKLIKKSKKNIKFHIFDSFEGLSEPTKEDRSDYKIKQRFKGNEEFIKNKLLKSFKFVEIYPGWIPKRFKILKNKKFSFVPIDLCLYKPTIQSLNFFYKKLKKGGIIISNSYNSNIFKGETKAWDEFFSKNKYSFMYKHALTTSFVIK